MWLGRRLAASSPPFHPRFTPVTWWTSRCPRQADAVDMDTEASVCPRTRLPMPPSNRRVAQSFLRPYGTKKKKQNKNGRKEKKKNNEETQNQQKEQMDIRTLRRIKYYASGNQRTSSWIFLCTKVVLPDEVRVLDLRFSLSFA